MRFKLMDFTLALKFEKLLMINLFTDIFYWLIDFTMLILFVKYNRLINIADKDIPDF